MMKDIKTADVVVTNPTHISVVLKYDSETMVSPILVGKGQDFLALRIREIAKEKIIQNGGKVSGSVSNKTSYVIAGENPGSKLKEAEKLKVKIITEVEFLKML